MDIVARVKAILLTPNTEWPAIRAEQSSVESIYRDYLVYIAAVPAIAGLIGALVGHASIVAALVLAVLTFVLGLVGVYVLALIIDKLAPNFGGTPNFLNAFKLSGYSTTALWLAGIFAIIPSLKVLSIVGVYSLYLLYIGLPELMRAPQDKAMTYTVVVILAAVVLYIVVAALVALLIGGLFMASI
jgi:Yip1 domain